MSTATYTVILDPEPAGGYSAYCPALPGCVAQGETLDEVLEAIKTSIQQSLTAWAEDEMTPPVDSVDYLGDELYEILAARARRPTCRSPARPLKSRWTLEIAGKANSRTNAPLSSPRRTSPAQA